MTKPPVALLLFVVTIAIGVTLSFATPTSGPKPDGPECKAALAYLQLRAGQSTKTLQISSRTLEAEVNNEALSALLEREPERAGSNDLTAYRKQIVWRHLDIVKTCIHIGEWAKRSGAKILTYEPQFRNLNELDAWFESNHEVAIGMPAIAPDGRVYFDVRQGCGRLCGSFGRAIMERNQEGAWVLVEERVYAIS